MESEETQKNQLIVCPKYITQGNQFFLHKNQVENGLKLVHSIYFG